MSMKQCMTVEFVRVNSLLINGCQLGPYPLFKKHNFISATKNTTSSATYSGKNHYQFTMHSTGSPEVRCLCFIPMRQYLLMLISHMSEDDETHFYGLRVRPLAVKGLS